MIFQLTSELLSHVEESHYKSEVVPGKDAHDAEYLS
jgi:hypothetical protein